MPKQYQLSAFLELAPNPLLRPYLAKLNIATSLDWDALPESPCNEVLAAVLAAGVAAERQIDIDFREINSHAIPSQIEKIISTGKRLSPPIEVSEELAAAGSNLAQCFWVFLNYPRLFSSCTLLEQVNGHKFESRDNLPVATHPLDDESTEIFRGAISQHFQETQGRGQGCVVEHVQRDGKHLLFCHLQDHAHTGHEFVGKDQIEATTRWPVFDVILVYDPEGATLQTYMPGSKKHAEDIESVFGKCILGNDLKALPKISATYNLDHLLAAEHVFEILTDDPIQSIMIRELRLEYGADTQEYVTYSVPIHASVNRVYTLALEAAQGDEALLREFFKPVKAKFTATLKTARGRPRTKTFTVTWPNGCDLTIDAIDEAIKQLLKRWCIDVSGRTDDDDLEAA